MTVDGKCWGLLYLFNLHTAAILGNRSGSLFWTRFSLPYWEKIFLVRLSYWGIFTILSNSTLVFLSASFLSLRRQIRSPSLGIKCLGIWTWKLKPFDYRVIACLVYGEKIYRGGDKIGAVGKHSWSFKEKQVGPVVFKLFGSLKAKNTLRWHIY